MARVLHSVGTEGVLERVSMFSVTPCSPHSVVSNECRFRNGAPKVEAQCVSMAREAVATVPQTLGVFLSGLHRPLMLWSGQPIRGRCPQGAGGRGQV